MRRIVLALAGVTFGASIIAAALLLDSERTSLEHELGFELARFVMQLVLVGVFGGALLQELGQQREKRLAANEFRKGILKRLAQAYTNAKRARLTLRANSSGAAPSGNGADGRLFPWDLYTAQINSLGATQLELEMLLRDLEFFPKAFQETRRQPLVRATTAMENYLKRLLKEYRDHARAAVDHSGHVELQRLPAMSRFARSTSDGSDFRADFAGNFYAALQEIQAERLRL